MKNAYLLFIESNTSGSGEDFIVTARNLGFKTLLLTSDTERYPWASGLTECKELDTNNIHELKGFIRTFLKKNEIKGISTSSEYYVYTVAQLTNTFNFPGLSPQAVKHARDKSKMRDVLQEHNLGYTQHIKLSSNDDIENKITQFNFPVVVKPASGSGSEDVFLCQNRQDAFLCLDRILSKKYNARGQENPDFVLIEQYIDGPEFSVEIFCSPEPVVITIVKKYLSAEPYFVETGHDIPAQLTQSEKDKVVNEAKNAVKAIGLNFGCVHVELRLSKSGPIIIEINPRLAGGMLPSLIKYSFQLDMIELQVRSAVGMPVTLNKQPVLRVYSSIRYFIPPHNGKIAFLKNLEDIACKPGIKNVQINSRFTNFCALKGDFTDRVGSIIATDENQQKCIENIENALNEVEYVYEENN